MMRPKQKQKRRASAFYAVLGRFDMCGRYGDNGAKGGENHRNTLFSGL
jgi:hypothetical protein